jgi:hypothetical protein
MPEIKGGTMESMPNFQHCRPRPAPLGKMLRRNNVKQLMLDV